MPASGVFATAQTQLVSSLTSLGLAVVTDPRNVRPLTVLVNPPNVEIKNYNWADMTFSILVCAAPPGNQDAVDFLITTADDIMNSPIVVIDANPDVVTIGNQDLPAYRMTVRMGGEGH
jgi:hypothetical protein